MIRKLKSLIGLLYVKVQERTHKGRLKYLYKKNNSDTLIVVFSGFADKPLYNYVRTLRGVKADKIFILDDFGYKGSYYWYENGSEYPLQLVKSLIFSKFNGKYRRLITIGSSKGGTCAIYFGLMFGATDIYAGACQYYVGTYLNSGDKIPVFKGMMGAMADNNEQVILDAQMPEILEKYKGSSSKIHLLYSKEEHTYTDDIIHLINDLDKNHIQHEDKVESFSEHGEVGRFFSPWLKYEIDKTLKNEK